MNTFPLSPAQQSANSIANNFSNFPATDLKLYRQRYAQIFGNATSTPTQITTALNTEAAAIFAMLASQYTYLVAIGANLLSTDIIPAYTANSDGTVTLTSS